MKARRPEIVGGGGLDSERQLWRLCVLKTRRSEQVVMVTVISAGEEELQTRFALHRAAAAAAAAAHSALQLCRRESTKKCHSTDAARRRPRIFFASEKRSAVCLLQKPEFQTAFSFPFFFPSSRPCAPPRKESQAAKIVEITRAGGRLVVLTNQPLARHSSRSARHLWTRVRSQIGCRSLHLQWGWLARCCIAAHSTPLL